MILRIRHRLRQLRVIAVIGIMSAAVQGQENEKLQPEPKPQRVGTRTAAVPSRIILAETPQSASSMLALADFPEGSGPIQITGPGSVSPIFSPTQPLVDMGPRYCASGDDNVVFTTTSFGAKLCIDATGTVTNRGKIFESPDRQVFRSLTLLQPNTDDVAALASATGDNLLLYLQGQAKSYNLPVPGCGTPNSRSPVMPCPQLAPSFLAVVAGGKLYTLTADGTIETVDGSGSLVHGLTVDLSSQVVSGSSSAIYVAISAKSLGKMVYALMRYDLTAKRFRSVYTGLEPITTVLVTH